MARTLRVRLAGANASLGRVPASDVAKLLLGVERAVARASGHVLGRRLPATGRRGKLVEELVRFRLVAIEDGSLSGVLELPEIDDEDTFDIDVEHLGEQAVEAALKTAAGELDDRDTASAWSSLAREIGVGPRYESIALELPDEPEPSEPVVIDVVARERLDRLTEGEPEAREDGIVGVLFEADFERHTAHLRTAAGEKVSVSFSEEQADDIHEALRRRTELVGEITYDPETSSALSVRLREVTMADQLAWELDAGDFWTDQPVSRLVRERGVKPAPDLEALGDPDVSDHEAESYLAALGIGS